MKINKQEEPDSLSLLIKAMNAKIKNNLQNNKVLYNRNFYGKFADHSIIINEQDCKEQMMNINFEDNQKTQQIQLDFTNMNQNITNNEKQPLQFRNTQTNQQIDNNLFNGIQFFLIEDINGLGKKTIQIFIENIKKRGGLAFKFEEVGNLSQVVISLQKEEKKFFFVTSTQVNQNYLKYQMNKQGIDLSMQENHTIESLFISDSIKQNQLQDFGSYILKKQQLQEVDSQHVKQQEKSKNEDMQIKNEIQEDIKINQKNQVVKDQEDEYLRYLRIEKELDRQLDDIKEKNKQKNIQKCIKSDSQMQFNVKKEILTQQDEPTLYQVKLEQQLKQEVPFKQEFISQNEENIIDILQLPTKKVKCIQIDENKSQDDPSSQIENQIFQENLIDITVENNNVKKVSNVAIPGQKRRNKFWDKNQNLFMFAKEQPLENLNAHITDQLQKLLDVYTVENDFGRCTAYRRAIVVLRSLKYKVSHISQVANKLGIGQRIKDKIQEILVFGTLKKADLMYNEEKHQSIRKLSKIWGIGPVSARKLYDDGYKTIDDLRKNPQILTEQQIKGLNYYEDLQCKISRSEATLIVEIVQKAIDEISNGQDLYKSTACGSYRRGKAECGDVDVIICRKDGEDYGDFLKQLVYNLQNKGFIKEILCLPSQHSSHGCESFMGICKLDEYPKFRRIDIKIYPSELYGFALLYFTGSGPFNRSMRLYAKKRGLMLSDIGLIPCQRLSSNKKMKTGIHIPGHTEEQVFDALNLKYIEPSHRDL